MPPLPRSSPPRALLVHHSAPAQRWRALVVHGPTVTIGAAPTCDIVLASEGVAPRHCTLHQRPRGFLVHDHGAPLGTYLDTHRLQAPTMLTAPTALVIGPHHLHLVPLPHPSTLDEPAGRPPPPPPPPHAPQRPRPAPTTPSTRPPSPLLLAGLGIGAATSALTLTLALIAIIADPPPGAFTSRQRSAAPSLPSSVLSTIRTQRPSNDPPAPPAPSYQETPSPDRDPTQPSPLRVEDHPDPSSPRSPLRVEDHPDPSSPRSTLRVEHGETWISLADRLGRDVHALQADNPHLRRPLRRGDRLRIHATGALSPIDTCAPPLAVPDGAHAVGAVDRGLLRGAVRLPQLSIYRLRCPAHAFASSTTAAQLIAAINCFRDHTRYPGEIVIGDLSRESGGPLGPHRSHQTGHDVDLWLPTLHGDYLRGCHHCATDYCRPEPEDIDWLATWQLTDALAATGGVHVIFLDRRYHPQLAAAALHAGVDPQRVADRLPAAALAAACADAACAPPRPTSTPLIQHADGHRSHLHVRFKCPEAAPECQTRPSLRAGVKTP